MKNKKNITLLLIVIFTITSVSAQEFPEKQLMRKLKACKIEMDEGNGDGVFKAQSIKSKKWGMYQWMYKGTKVLEMIPMEYDSVDYFPFNGNFTAVYNNDKIGIYLCKWTYDDDAKQTVPCEYEDYKRFNVRDADYSSTTYLAMKKNGKWGWVDWFTGKEKTEFIYDTADDVPYPDFEQKYW